MRKFIVIILASHLVGSCGEFKAMMNEEYSQKDSISYFIDPEKRLLNVVIDGVPHKFLYDTGTSAALLNYPQFDFSENSPVRSRAVYGIDKRHSTVRGFVFPSFITDFHIVKNKYLYFAQPAQNVCGNLPAYHGLLDRQIAPENTMMELNYEKGYIKYSKTADLEGYSPLPAKFSISTGTFRIKLKISGIEDYYLFDTGNLSNYLLLDPEKYAHLDNSIYSVKSMMMGVNETLIPSSIELFKGDFEMDDLRFEFPVSVNRSTPGPNVGHMFVKYFNWVIDQKNNLVYFKPIDREKLVTFRIPTEKQKQIGASIIKGELIISQINFYSDKYRFGDTITHVDGVMVTPENICEIGRRLNQTKDWDKLAIITSAANKKFE